MTEATSTRKRREPPPGGTYHTGWSWPVDARLIHYADRGVLICGSNYGVFPGEEHGEDFDPEADRNVHNICRTCLRKWQARRAKQEAKP